MTTDPKPMCKELISSTSAWRSYQCDRPAVTEAGYCRIHDPELRKERAKKRGPTKWERERAAWEALHGAVDEVRAHGHTELAERILRLAFLVRNP